MRVPDGWAGDDVSWAMEVVAQRLGPPTEIQDGPRFRWKWRPVAFGACPRCRWPAHTLAPNSVPFHPFCWLNPDPVSSWEEWLRRQDGDSTRKRPDDRVDQGERQWCATEKRWFTVTDERLAACVDHAAETTARWQR